LRNLKRSGYIEIKTTDSFSSVRLTTKGKIKHLENSSDKETDGRLRIISFDIPEDINKTRRQFCRSIKRVGFRRLQKSLWVCPYIKADEIDLIIDELNIKKFVAYFIVEKSNVEKQIEKMFKEKKIKSSQIYQNDNSEMNNQRDQILTDRLKSD